MTINLATHVARLLALQRADLLTRRKWTGTHADGRAMTSMLAALSPETGVARSAEACPAKIMPKWLAHLTLWFDDAGTDAAWPAMVTRFAAIAGGWHVLSDTDWRRLDFAVRAICVREAATHIKAAQVIASCAGVAALCDRAAAGDAPAATEWTAAWVTATKDAETLWVDTLAQARIEVAGGWAMQAAAAAAMRGADAAADAARAAAGVAALGMARVARAAADAAALGMARVAADAATAAAADRMTTMIFAAIDARIAGRIQSEFNLNS